MQTTSDILTNSPIGNRIKNLKPIGNRQLVKTVDQLLAEYDELIEPEYKKWFAEKFYLIHPDVVRRCASEAKQEGKNPKRLFSFLIKKVC